MWDTDLKITKEHFGRKIKSTGNIYLPGSQYREAEGYLKLRLCLQNAIINYAPRIEKHINKLELYNQCPTRRVKDRKMSEIENYLCEGVHPNMPPMISFSGMYQKSFIYCRNRTNYH